MDRRLKRELLNDDWGDVGTYEPWQFENPPLTVILETGDVIKRGLLVLKKEKGAKVMADTQKETSNKATEMKSYLKRQADLINQATAIEQAVKELFGESGQELIEKLWETAELQLKEGL